MTLSQIQPLTFGEILTKLLAERRLSNKRAAMLAGTSITTLHDWKNGRTPRDLRAVKRLADALQVSLAYLLTGEHDKCTLESNAETKTELFAFEASGQIRLRQLPDG